MQANLTITIRTDAAYIFGDMRDEAVLRKALEGVEVIFHEAAAVGVGQSMYEIRRVGNEVPETKRGKIGRPIPTSEDKPLHPTSINPFRKSVYKTFRKSFIKKSCPYFIDLKEKM